MKQKKRIWRIVTKDIIHKQKKNFKNFSGKD